MRNKLDSNVSLLMVYFNVMIMSKVFKINHNLPNSDESNEINNLKKYEQLFAKDYEADSEVTVHGKFAFYLSPKRF